MIKSKKISGFLMLEFLFIVVIIISGLKWFLNYYKSSPQINNNVQLCITLGLKKRNDVERHKNHVEYPIVINGQVYLFHYSESLETKEKIIIIKYDDKIVYKATYTL